MITTKLIYPQYYAKNPTKLIKEGNGNRYEFDKEKFDSYPEEVKKELIKHKDNEYFHGYSESLDKTINRFLNQNVNIKIGFISMNREKPKLIDIKYSETGIDGGVETSALVIWDDGY